MKTLESFVTVVRLESNWDAMEPHERVEMERELAMSVGLKTRIDKLKRYRQ